MEDPPSSNVNSDDFLWQVCFLGDDDHANSNRQTSIIDTSWRVDDTSSSSDDDYSGRQDDEGASGIKTYRLPSTSIALELRPLPKKRGVWSSLGADAWYSSALLSTILLNGQIKFEYSATKREIVALELGSGAVGLSGFACAVALSSRALKAASSRVLLTDNDSDVLKQLGKNIENNKSLISSNVNIEARHLDWADFTPDLPETIDLVIGSELVYTNDTGSACAKLILELLKRHNKIKIVIVQVVDRFGWNEILIPKLEEAGASIQAIHLSAETHATAMKLIPRGGTLDPYAYGAFEIQNESSNV
jgi:hypothetical protein